MSFMAHWLSPAFLELEKQRAQSLPCALWPGGAIRCLWLLQIPFTLLRAGVQPWGATPRAAKLPKTGSAAPLCGEGGEADGFLCSLALSVSPSAGVLRELCWLLLPPGLPSSLLWCGAGSSPLPQAAFAISPELCWKSCHFTFFFHL